MLSVSADTLKECWTRWVEEVRRLSLRCTSSALWRCLEAPAGRPPPPQLPHRLPPWAAGRPACWWWRTGVCRGRESGACAGKWRRSPSRWSIPPRRLLACRCWSYPGSGQCATPGGLWCRLTWWGPLCGPLWRDRRRKQPSSPWPPGRGREQQILQPAFHQWTTFWVWPLSDKREEASREKTGCLCHSSRLALMLNHLFVMDLTWDNRN